METSRPSLSTAFAGVLASFTGMVQARLELAGIELGEEIGRVVVMFVTAGALLVFGMLALLVGSLVVVFAFDGSARLIAMSLLALLYAVIALVLGLWLRQHIVNRPPMFAATLAELARDQAALMKRNTEIDGEAPG